MTPREPGDPSLEEVEHDFTLPADADLQPDDDDTETETETDS